MDQEFREQAKRHLIDAGLTEDEAELLIEDEEDLRREMSQLQKKGESLPGLRHNL